MDTSRLGEVAAALMESLAQADENLKDEGVQSELGEVMVLAEVKYHDEDGDGTHIAWRCSDERAWVQMGLIHAALDQERETEHDEDDS